MPIWHFRTAKKTRELPSEKLGGINSKIDVLVLLKRGIYLAADNDHGVQKRIINPTGSGGSFAVGENPAVEAG